jgi:hypothetical protein
MLPPLENKSGLMLPTYLIHTVTHYTRTELLGHEVEYNIAPLVVSRHSFRLPRVNTYMTMF